nr:putative protein [Melanopsichium pennsylvanicum 4]
MIPDHFDSDEGHGPHVGGGSPEMSEHYNQQYNNFGPQYESGISAGAIGAMAAHNETGGPRPPTMFAKHAAGVQQNQAPQIGGYYKDGDFSNAMPPMPHEYHAPPIAAFAAQHSDHQQYLDEPGYGQAQRSISPAPQLPPLAAFGGDPYSIAGVGRGQGHNNVANPYAHLDRSHQNAAMSAAGFTPGSGLSTHDTRSSGSVSSGGDTDQRHASISAAEALAAGLAHQSSLNRSASTHHHQDGQSYDTAGRPSTSEGRSGTPDLPNVQQTYALQDGEVASAQRFSASSQDMLNQHSSLSEGGALPNPFENGSSNATTAAPQQYQVNQRHSNQQQQQQQQLQVRNLVPNQGGLSAGQRPISTASSFADPEDAYGGVY